MKVLSWYEDPNHIKIWQENSLSQDPVLLCEEKSDFGSFWIQTSQHLEKLKNKWTCYKWTTELSSVSLQYVTPVISAATPSISACNFWTVCGLVQYARSLRLPQRKWSRIHVWWTWWPGPPTPEALQSWFDRTRLPNT